MIPVVVGGHRAPDCLIRVQIEFLIFLKSVNKLHRNLGVVVGKRAKLLIGALRIVSNDPVIRLAQLLTRAEVRLTELAFVATGVIQLFYFIVSKRTFDVIADSFVCFLALDVPVRFKVRTSVICLIVVVETRVFVMSI